ncbi:hypothetical protein EYF80_008823 [Liparis tanakae]|uniref:Uncharacterized protein n=1 Tax=Liparis tanakae TaxID=230148 RepID=A0A4Z2IT97_9TELE|nr:hypothetical protein EYF80_008823 [Liparis tanakae]
MPVAAARAQEREANGGSTVRSESEPQIPAEWRLFVYNCTWSPALFSLHLSFTQLREKSSHHHLRVEGVSSASFPPRLSNLRKLCYKVNICRSQGERGAARLKKANEEREADVSQAALVYAHTVLRRGLISQRWLHPVWVDHGSFQKMVFLVKRDRGDWLAVLAWLDVGILPVQCFKADELLEMYGEMSAPRRISWNKPPLTLTNPQCSDGRRHNTADDECQLVAQQYNPGLQLCCGSQRGSVHQKGETLPFH